MVHLRSMLVTVGVLAVTLSACGPKKQAATPSASTGSVSDKCPDLAKGDEVAAFDFAKEYNLSRDAADKLKAAALAGIEMSALSDKLDAEFGIACAQIAHDLGNRGDWRSGNEACAAAIKAVQDTRAKLGPKATTSLVVRQPVCLVDAMLMTKCASICDSSVPAGKVKADCEQKAGRCDGNCEGVCEPKGPMKCEGSCSGTCEGQINGSCGGRCRGKCDGKPSNGACAGTCVGTCDKGAMNGECKGQCTGSCKMGKPGICDGLCSGGCNVEVSEPKCSSDFKTPEVSTDCRARCELAAMNKTECSTPQAGLVVIGGKDREAENALKSSLDKALPNLLKVLFEVGDKAPKRVLNAQAVIDGARSGFKDMARSGGAGTAAASEAQLVKCFDEPFKKSAAAAASVKTELDQAIGVRAEATK